MRRKILSHLLILIFLPCSICFNFFCAIWWCLGICGHGRGVLLWEGTPCHNSHGCHIILGDEMEESISHWTLNSSLLFHTFPLLHAPYDDSWRCVGIEVEESFSLKALPHLELLYEEFILCERLGDNAWDLFATNIFLPPFLLTLTCLIYGTREGRVLLLLNFPTCHKYVVIYWNHRVEKLGC